MIALQPGTYVVKANRLNVRGAPDGSHNGTLANQQLTGGKSFEVFEVVSGKVVRDGDSLWGRITPPGVNVPRYVCLTNYNTVFAELEIPKNAQVVATSTSVNAVFLSSIYEWAKSKGYTGPGPF